jgi:hypothetical protein
MLSLKSLVEEMKEKRSGCFNTNDFEDVYLHSEVR